MMLKFLNSLTQESRRTRRRTNEILRAVGESGVLVLPKELDGAHCDEIENEFERLMTSDIEGVETHAERPNLLARRVEYNKVRGAMYPGITRFVDNPVYSLAAQQYFKNRAIYPQKLYCVRSTYADDQQSALPYLPHTDKLHMFKFILYLSNVTTDDDGPLHIMRGEHRKFRQIRTNWLASGNDYRERNNIISNLESLRPIYGERGSVIVLDTDTPHHAGRVAPGHERKVIRIDVIAA